MKTMCVVRFTFGRVTTLEQMMSAKGIADKKAVSAPSGVNPAAVKSRESVSLPASLMALEDGYKLCSRLNRRTGLWYHEVRVDLAAIAELGEKPFAYSLPDGYRPF